MSSDEFGWATTALESAFRARAPTLPLSTPLVAQLARRVARELGLDEAAQSHLDAAIRVRDVGMLGLPDEVLLSTAPLTPAEWVLVQRHPALGAELLMTIAPVAGLAPTVRSHHERWDGEGYPDGLSGDAIPSLSRLVAICDAFVAMASDRSYRRGLGADAALEHIRLERGAQFDPDMADAFLATMLRIETDGRSAPAAAEPPAAKATRPFRGPDRGDLAEAIAQFDVVPAFAPACEQAIAACEAGAPGGGEIVSALETDTGLTVAILRRAQAVAGGKPIGNVADAVQALSPAEIQTTIRELPQAQFPWRTTPNEVLMHRSRVHAQSVARAADRIAQEVGLAHNDDLLVAALLHDIGKLVLGRLAPDAALSADVRGATPEQRLLDEQRMFGLDHASVGAELVRRWGLPAGLGRALSAHHTSEAPGDIATYVRLADMLAHHAQGDAVDRAAMLAVAETCGLSVATLRDVMFDLPHSAGSRRRRGERSPLSPRETETLRGLAKGSVYKKIAIELGVTASTVRSHLHSSYEKLGVVDRAQAVLRATEMGWI